MAQTVAELIDTMILQYGRGEDADISSWLRGINWVKGQLCGRGFKRLIKVQNITLTPGKYKYISGESDGLPSDFNMIDQLWYRVGNSEFNKVPIAEGELAEIINDTISQYYPLKYHITADNDLYLGDGIPSASDIVEIYYYYKPVDYTATSTEVPIFANLYGDDVYLYGMDYIQAQITEHYERMAQMKRMFDAEMANIYHQEGKKAPPVIRSYPRYTTDYYRDFDR